MKLSQLVLLSLALCCLVQFGEGLECYIGTGSDKSSWRKKTCRAGDDYCQVNYMNNKGIGKPPQKGLALLEIDGFNLFFP